MLTSLLASFVFYSATFLPPKNVRILFFGNSHTVNNDVPGMVRALLESSGQFRVVTETRTGAFLTDIWQNPANRELVLKGKWSFVVLQAAKLSSSHKYNYSHDGAIQLAKLAMKSGATVLLFAEWPRRDWVESNYILSEYGEIARAAKGAKVLPIPQSWDVARKRLPKVELWQPDGNHASLPGSYLAACVISQQIAGKRGGLKWTPRALDASTAIRLRAIAIR